MEALRNTETAQWARNRLGARLASLISSLRIAVLAKRLEHPFLARENLFEDLAQNERLRLIRLLDADLKMDLVSLLIGPPEDGE